MKNFETVVDALYKSTFTYLLTYLHTGRQTELHTKLATSAAETGARVLTSTNVQASIELHIQLVASLLPPLHLHTNACKYLLLDPSVVHRGGGSERSDDPPQC